MAQDPLPADPLDSPLLTDDRLDALHSPSSSSPPSSYSASSDPSVLSRNSSFSRLNAQAPEFVPRAPARTDVQQPRLVVSQNPPAGLVHVFQSPNSSFHVPIQSHVSVSLQNHHAHHRPQHVQYHSHHHPQYYAGFGDSEVAVPPQQSPSESDHAVQSRNCLSEEATQKILNQVEYYFSDVNLATTDHLMRFINKDPEGYVPISVVASFKKIKSLTSSHSQLAAVLRNSAKLVVSEDGKKVKRRYPLTEADMEELQSRIIVAENLPEDHCHQNLMKVFSAVGSVKTIRTCPPQVSSGGGSSASRSAKADNMLYSNKLHAFVEYESVELAEKAVAELNGEGSWRSSLRLRLLLKRMSKPALPRGGKKGPESDLNCEDDDASTSERQPNVKQSEDPSPQSEAHSNEHAGEEHVNEKDGGIRKCRPRGRGKGRGRSQYHHHNNGNCGGPIGTPPSNSFVNSELSTVVKQPPGPRMPDGTRGFTMGRGKPVAVNIAQ